MKQFLDEGIVGVNFAVLGAAITSEKHGTLPGSSMANEARKNQWGRFSLQRQKPVPLPKNRDFCRKRRRKSFVFCTKCATWVNAMAMDRCGSCGNELGPEFSVTRIPCPNCGA